MYVFMLGMPHCIVINYHALIEMLGREIDLT